MIGPNGKPAPTEAHGHRRRDHAGAGGVDRRADRVPGGAARRQTPGDPAQERHDLGAGLHARAGRTTASTAAGTCSTPSTKRSLRGPRGNRSRTSTPTATKPPTGAKLKAVRVNPGTVLVQAHPVESATGKVTQRLAEQLVRAQRRPGADGADITNPQQSFDEGTAAPASRTSPSASPRTARTSSNRSPRKSPSAARKRSCRASPRKRRCSTSRSCSTAS